MVAVDALKQILLGIRDLLKSPNPKFRAVAGIRVYTQDRTENRLVKEREKIRRRFERFGCARDFFFA